MKCSKWMILPAVCLAISLTGCGSSDPVQSTASTVGDPRYVLESEPDGAIAVGEARESSQDDSAVTLVGMIGGSSEPFVEGMAAFTIVDLKIPHCPPEENCPQPWDYCCTQNQVRSNIATVKVVDADGKPVSEDARVLLGVKELSTVVVTGKAKRDDRGNLTVAADKVFVRSGT